MSAETVWLGAPPEACDLCKAPIKNQFYDAKTVYRSWGCLCELCFLTHGVGLGHGQGQKYERARDGRFHKTDG